MSEVLAEEFERYISKNSRDEEFKYEMHRIFKEMDDYAYELDKANGKSMESLCSDCLEFQANGEYLCWKCGKLLKIW